MVSRKEQIEQLKAQQADRAADTNALLERIQKILEKHLPDMDWRDRVEIGYDIIYAVSKWAIGDGDTVTFDSMRIKPSTKPYPAGTVLD